MKDYVTWMLVFYEYFRMSRRLCFKNYDICIRLRDIDRRLEGRFLKETLRFSQYWWKSYHILLASSDIHYTNENTFLLSWNLDEKISLNWWVSSGVVKREWTQLRDQFLLNISESTGIYAIFITTLFLLSIRFSKEVHLEEALFS